MRLSRTRSRSTWAARARTCACTRRRARARAASARVGGFPIRLPALDIHTIGAGGGSIARIDAGGALTVGPESAGAAPGPACYGLGGTAPTVTDADLVLGRIDDQVDVSRSRPARRRRGARRAAARRCARGRRGRGRRRGDGAGGAGGHGRARRRPASARADRVRRRGPAARVRDRGRARHGRGRSSRRVRVWARRSACCARPRRQEVVQSVGAATPPRLDAARAEVAARARALVGDDADDRDRGRLPLRRPEPRDHGADADDFAAEHERRNGHARPGAPVEVVAVRAARDRRRAHARDRPPGRRAGAGARTRGRRRGGLHGVDPRGLGRRTARPRCLGARRAA